MFLCGYLMNYLGQRLESHIGFALFGAFCYGCFSVFHLLSVFFVS